MGNPFLLQACLRLNVDEISKPLQIGKNYHFHKEGHRLYQIKVPMDLRTSDWKALGRCVVTEFTVGNRRTEGTFVMVKIFDSIQAEQVTKAYVSDEEVEQILRKVQE